MPNPHEMTAGERQRLDRWVARAMHDLVKYLEMMPRSLDWDAIEEDDLEILYEAAFETRASRGQVHSAREVFEETLQELGEPLTSELDVVEELWGQIAALEEVCEGLLEASLEDVDVQQLKERVFAPGNTLRRFRKSLAT